MLPELFNVWDAFPFLFPLDSDRDSLQAQF